MVQLTHTITSNIIKNVKESNEYSFMYIIVIDSKSNDGTMNDAGKSQYISSVWEEVMHFE